MEIFDKPGDGRLERPQVQMVQKCVMQFAKVGSWRRQPGHRIFSYNTRTGEIREVKPEVTAVLTSGGQVIGRQKIFADRECFYGEALNIRNFKKLLRREGYDIL